MSLNLHRAVTLEKTAGWLQDGMTILAMKSNWRLRFEYDEWAIQWNPLWMREIELAEFQQNRHIQRLKADVQMREGEDEEIRMRDWV